MRRSTIFILSGLFLAGFLTSAQARGRKPDSDDDKDTFPDYNRLEMHPKPKEASPAPVDYPPVPPAPRPSLNTPANPLPSDDDTTPKPPPKVVPLPDGASEPPMPDDLINAPVSSSGTLPAASSDRYLESDFCGRITFNLWITGDG